MKFITNEPEEKQLTFEDVEVNQFFVDEDGDLCVKSHDHEYIRIAKPFGGISALRLEERRPDNMLVERILHEVVGIEF